MTNMKPMNGVENPRETRLSRELRQEEPSRPTSPRDAFDLARGKWLKGERIEVGALAEELGVARATVFRWVGTRDLLVGEIIWYLFEMLWEQAADNAQGTGADYGADFIRRLMESVLDAEPFRRFIEQSPEYALRILTSKEGPMQARVIQATTGMLEEQAAAGHITPALDMDDLAYVIVRIVESCLYSDQITGRQPNVPAACKSIHILLAATPDQRPSV